MTEHLIDRPVELGLCTRCQMPILAGYHGGLWTQVDLNPLDAAEEVIVILAGRATFDLIETRIGKAMYLRWRDSLLINAERKWTVLAEHPCRGGFIPWKQIPPAKAAPAEQPLF